MLIKLGCCLFRCWLNSSTANYTTNHNRTKQCNMYSARLRSQDWTAQHSRTPAVFYIQLCMDCFNTLIGTNCVALQAATGYQATWLLLTLPSALLWQQLGRLTCTCAWFEIAQSATDTTEGGHESSHGLLAFARWQESSYPISTILNPSGLKRPELESDNSPPLNDRV
jgi:hypothetical protein